MKRFIAIFLALSVSVGAQAGMVSTEAVHAEQMREQVMAQLSQPEMIELMAAHGVDRQEAAQRIARLTPSELNQLSAAIEDAPAGQGFVSVTIFLFAILVVSDALGYTDLFPFVHGPND